MDRGPHRHLTAPRASTPRSKPRVEERRQELLGRLQDLVLAEGFASLTVDEIAARLQCSKSTLYTLASSKESLVTTAIRHFLADVAERGDDKVSGVEPPADRIAGYLTAVGAEMRRMSQQCFEELGAHDATREVYLAHAATLRQRLAEFVQQGIEAGEFRAVDTAFVADVVSLLIDGIEWGRLREETDLSHDEAYDALSDLLLAALTNRDR